MTKCLIVLGITNNKTVISTFNDKATENNEKTKFLKIGLSITFLTYKRF